MKIRLVLFASLIVACAMPPLLAQNPSKPDLTVRQFQFAPTNNKVLRVNVANIGAGAAGASTLRLTIRQIKGASVGRTTEIQVPAIQGNKADWVLVDATSILPKDVSLKDTTFKLNVDAAEAVAESNEKNNEAWHNLK